LEWLAVVLRRRVPVHRGAAITVRTWAEPPLRPAAWKRGRHLLRAGSGNRRDIKVSLGVKREDLRLLTVTSPAPPAMPANRIGRAS